MASLFHLVSLFPFPSTPMFVFNVTICYVNYTLHQYDELEKDRESTNGDQGQVRLMRQVK